MPTHEVLRQPRFALFWGAHTLRLAGASVSGVALNVVVVTRLGATPLQISVLSALGVLPYLFLGLVVGALMDRWPRQRTLVLTSLGRACLLALVPLLMVTGHLSFPALALVALWLGVLVLFGDSAAQPLLPRLVPRRSLVMAHARLGQSETVAGTAGPALGGVLLTLIGAPLLFVADSALTGLAALLQARISVREPRAQARPAGTHLGHDIAEGMRFTYRHRTLRPLALSVHLWFLGNSLVMTVFAVFVLRELRVPAWGYGLALACAGVGGLAGTLVSPGLGDRLGAGRAILLGRTLVFLPWAALALWPPELGAETRTIVAVAAVQVVHGLAMGIEDANDTGYRQSVTPDRLQGRMNATIRTTNRVVFFFGALVSGLLATRFGYRATMGVGATAFVLAALVVALSPLRSARHAVDGSGVSEQGC
ncbi:MFS transporter [Aestuariimicrobium kwangyangense]|uniref:MFS transporter n=1 Tax=Aestuariimicrobium kwangyangense TaxID=396389 RepID=UPI0003B49E90|nr:MFS transporter [Aestuariimicrobium kwangyangense]